MCNCGVTAWRGNIVTYKLNVGEVTCQEYMV